MLSKQANISVRKPVHIKPLVKSVVEFGIIDISPNYRVIGLIKTTRGAAVEVDTAHRQLPVGIVHTAGAAVLGGKADTAYLAIRFVRSKVPHMTVSLAILNTTAFVGIISAD